MARKGKRVLASLALLYLVVASGCKQVVLDPHPRPLVTDNNITDTIDTNEPRIDPGASIPVQTNQASSCDVQGLIQLDMLCADRAKAIIEGLGIAVECNATGSILQIRGTDQQILKHHRGPDRIHSYLQL